MFAHKLHKWFYCFKSRRVSIFLSNMQVYWKWLFGRSLQSLKIFKLIKCFKRLKNLNSFSNQKVNGQKDRNDYYFIILSLFLWWKKFSIEVTFSIFRKQILGSHLCWLTMHLVLHITENMRVWKRCWPQLVFNLLECLSKIEYSKRLKKSQNFTLDRNDKKWYN